MQKKQKRIHDQGIDMSGRKEQMMTISAEVLKDRIMTGGEYALIDVRTEGAFAKAHLLFAVSVPLDRLELKFDRLVPRLETPHRAL